VGNSNIVLGTYDGDRLVKDWRISTDKSKTTDEYGVLLHDLFRLAGIAFTDITGIIISSVVPTLTGVLEKLSQQYFDFKPYVVGPGIKTGIQVAVGIEAGDVGPTRAVETCKIAADQYLAVCLHGDRIDLEIHSSTGVECHVQVTRLRPGWKAQDRGEESDEGGEKMEERRPPAAQRRGLDPK